jgi:uncharacterized membrane protein HdeD (DUF308 family)
VSISSAEPRPTLGGVRDWLSLSWKVLVLRGVVGVVFGLMAMTWPGLTILALVVLWGIWALVDAGMSASAVFAPGVGGGTRLLFAVIAAAGLIAGLFALLRPGVAAVTITWFLGIWLMVRGLVTLIGAFTPGTTSRGVILLSGVVDMVLGLLLVANPGRAALDIAWLLGLFAVVWGIALIAVGVLTRKALNQLPAEQPAA